MQWDGGEKERERVREWERVREREREREVWESVWRKCGFFASVLFPRKLLRCFPSKKNDNDVFFSRRRTFETTTSRQNRFLTVFYPLCQHQEVSSSDRHSSFFEPHSLSKKIATKTNRSLKPKKICNRWPNRFFISSFCFSASNLELEMMMTVIIVQLFCVMLLLLGHDTDIDRTCSSCRN